jgi:hypothetical protein
MPEAQTTRTERVTQAEAAAPGTPHPDPVLAARGWQASSRGVWTRGAVAAIPHAETRAADREAG